MAVMAESPLLLEAYQQLYLLGSRTHFTAEELQIVYMTISYERDCNYCMAAHSFQASVRDKVAPEVVTALREGQRLREPKLRALQSLANALSGGNDKPPAKLVNEFYQVGYTQEQLLELVLLLATKTLSNVAHQLTQAPLDGIFVNHQWLRAVPEAHLSSTLPSELATEPP